MKKGMLLKGLIGMLLLFPLYSQAVTLSGYLEVKRLLALDHPSNKQLESVTQAYLNGIANGFNFYAVAVKIENQNNDDFRPLYCPPPKVEQNGDFMVKHIDAYLDKNPEVKKKQKETPLELIYILALQDAYPCHADGSL
ncbi:MULTISPECIES: Rap1a/Tai family immunity protein [Proteus]|uniref:Rap1a/Tai family immunity protein n=1 Tax=Proteus TaxID=583 RepID=UPI000BFDAF75|nr:MULTISPECIES: Rap1a/Tai family immunity protein [Proteus]ATM99463.1 hypothetical protein CRN77_06865 [Proteus vulgaris]MBG2838669.1 hypothetical protein [Proteus terrae subsp. cibarius]MBG2870241.1 hypothetical protein [Proteus terrae subsp. cibarius]MBG5949343.1 hypothetical protein [Proteus terrae]MCE9840025.1 hypothetical protein [Proteus terrae]